MDQDVFYDSKNDILNKLSKIENLIFVGGASEYIQGVKHELRDIDVVVTDIDELKKIGYVFSVDSDLFYGLSGRRAVIKLKNVLIDIFIEDHLPDSIIVDGFRCETIESMILLRENTLKFNGNRLIEQIRSKIHKNLDRLKLWQQEKSQH